MKNLLLIQCVLMSFGAKATIFEMTAQGEIDWEYFYSFSLDTQIDGQDVIPNLFEYGDLVKLQITVNLESKLNAGGVFPNNSIWNYSDYIVTLENSDFLLESRGGDYFEVNQLINGRISSEVRLNNPEFFSAPSYDLGSPFLASGDLENSFSIAGISLSVPSPYDYSVDDFKKLTPSNIDGANIYARFYAANGNFGISADVDDISFRIYDVNAPSTFGLALIGIFGIFWARLASRKD